MSLRINLSIFVGIFIHTKKLKTMFKKLLSILSLGLLVSTGVSAQSFTMSPANDTISVNTTGQGTYNSGEGTYSNTIDLTFHINNTAADPLIFKWKLLSDSTEHPAGWLLTGICDNVICRSPYSDFYYHIEQTSFAIAPGETDPNKTLLEARIYAPVGSANGTGVFRVKLTAYNSSDANFANPLQTKTVVFIVKKNVTGVATIEANDKRVTLYPNPATSALQVYADKNLNAQSISIMNISGAQSMITAIEKGKETTSININSLAKGIYTVRVTDANGNMITTRKFVKK
jgi:uncharacterized protein with FMN-binding domain